MGSKAIILGTTLCLLLGVAAARAASTKTIEVDCNQGKSINKALEDEHDELIVEISGLCAEDVVVERPHVTLRGVDPSTDGVAAVATAAENPLGAAVLIRGTHSVRLENLQLTNGARSGLMVQGTGSDIFVDGCDLQGNATNGIELREGFVEVSASEISGSTFGVNARNESTLRAFDTEISGGFAALLIQGKSGALVVNGSATASGLSLWLNEGSATVYYTDLTGRVHSTDGSNGFLVQLSLDGHFTVEGKSRLGMYGVTQTSPGIDNLVRQDSTLSLIDGLGSTTLVRDTSFTEFSNADLGGGSTLPSISCDVSSNALCPAPTTVGASTCSFCP